ncbi:MAG: hypothetical protein SCI25_06000 [Desulfuromonadales bacterium]|nr:hypothetical protein [Desulfuromonadales bacterium]
MDVVFRAVVPVGGILIKFHASPYYPLLLPFDPVGQNLRSAQFKSLKSFRRKDGRREKGRAEKVVIFRGNSGWSQLFGVAILTQAPKYCQNTCAAAVFRFRATFFNMVAPGMEGATDCLFNELEGEGRVLQ